MFYGHAMFIGNRQKEAIYLSSPLYRCGVDQTVKIQQAADTLMTFAGEFFYWSRYNVVQILQIEVSFVSTGHVGLR